MLYKGRNLEEAVVLAEKHLGISRDKFSYSVTEKKIGLFKKEVEIHIQNSKNPSQGEIRNGKFIFHKGEGEVSITPTEEVIVSVNGKIITNTIKVGEGDKVELSGAVKKANKEFAIDIDNNGLKAKLRVTSTPEIIYNIADYNISTDITVNGKIKSIGKTEKISIDEVKGELLKSGIKFGVDFNDINNVLDSGNGIIASGKEAIHAIDDKIIYFFSVDNKRRPVEVNGKVDYYSIEEIEYVEENDVLAKIEEGSDGQNGVDIFGKIIEAKPKKKIVLKAGPGTILSDDKKSIMSLISGKPSLNGDIVCVLPVFQINGDADIKVGNLEFDGDIIISGNVTEGMKISAGGSIDIGASVLESSIHSKGDIKIRGNLIASELKAGNIQLNELKYIEKLNEIKKFLSGVIDITEKTSDIMAENYKNITRSQIVKKVIDSRYSNKKSFFIKLREEYSKFKMNHDITLVLNKFFDLYEAINNGKNIEFKSLIELNLEIERFLDLYNVTVTSGDIYISYSQNSKIYSSRDVFINGKGCYSTDIEAEGRITIEGYPGTFRSGTVYGKKGVYIKEVGSSAGIKSIIKTSSDGEIISESIYHNTLLVIDNFNYYVDEPIKKVKVYVKNGELVVEKFKS